MNHAYRQEHSRVRTRKKFTGYLPAKQAVFQLPPGELRAWLALPPETEPEPDEEILDKVSPDDSDMKLVDEDESSLVEQASFTETYSPVLPGAAPMLEESPLVATDDVYALKVFPGTGNGPNECTFAVPRWLDAGAPAHASRQVSILKQFLKTLAKWLEDEKQSFFKEPAPENFVSGEHCSPSNCIVKQDGLLVRINSRMPKDAQMRKDYLSRLIDKIWIFWPAYSMPLKAVYKGPYAVQFRKAWVIEGCRNTYAAAGEEFRNGLQEVVNIAKLKKQFDLCNPEERLAALCNHVGIKRQMEDIYQTILKEINNG